MGKIVKLSLMLATIVTGANAALPVHPLTSAFKSIDNGGTKSAIDAYKDGVGAEIVDKPGVATDNSAMNTLVLKYGETAKTNNVTIVEQVIYGITPVATQAEKALAGNLTLDGTTCNDSNTVTTGETWLNGICQGGTQSVFKSCKEIIETGHSIGNGIYTIDLDGNGGNAPFTVYCDMITDGGGWTLVAWNKGVSSAISANFFVAQSNIGNIANKDLTNAAASLNPELFSNTVNTSSAMLKASVYSATPLIDNGFGKWNYDTVKCTGNLMHTSRTAGCTQNANDNWDSYDKFNIAIGNMGIVPTYLVSGVELCYNGFGWCNFEFYLK